MGKDGNVRIDIAVFDGVDEMDALGPLEVLRSAATLGAEFDVRLVTLTGQARVSGAFGLTFAADGRFDPAVDVLVVPGGGWANRAAAGAWHEARRGDWPRGIRSVADRRALVSSVCTGAMLLAHAGVLTGHRATTHHTARADLASFGVDVVNDRVVDDGAVVTSGGVTSG